MLLKTDPLIIVVERMMQELRNNHNYQIVGYADVTSNGLCGNDENLPKRFRSWYDFSRTAAAVMRYYMLDATDMLQFHDPSFSKRGKQRNKKGMIQGPQRKPINMAAGDKNEAKRLAAEFDRQFPHYVLDNKFEDMVPGNARSYTSVMYVIDFENGEVYHIVSSLCVTLREPADNESMIIDAIPNIIAFKLTLQNLPDDLDPDTHPNTRQIKSLIEEHEQNVLEIDLQALRLDEDKDEDDDIENAVDNYFDQL